MFLENLLVFQSYNGAFAGHFELAFWLLPRVRRFRRVVFENRFVSLRRADSPLLVLLPDVARGVVLLSVMKRERCLLARQVQLKMPQSPRVFAVQIFPASFRQRPGQHRWRVVRHRPFCFLLFSFFGFQSLRVVWQRGSSGVCIEKFNERRKRDPIGEEEHKYGLGFCIFDSKKSRYGRSFLLFFLCVEKTRKRADDINDDANDDAHHERRVHISFKQP